MSGQSGEIPKFDPEQLRARFEAIPEFKVLQQEVPDALEMVTSTQGGDGLSGEESIKYWDEIGAGQGGFYDDIRENGCSSCGSHTPGCCDGCA